MYRHQIAKPGSREYVNGQDTCVKCGAVRVLAGQATNATTMGGQNFMSRGWVLDGEMFYVCPVERELRR